MAGGRPTVMTEYTLGKLEEGFTMGFTDEQACLFANIGKDALYDYCKKHPKYTDRKEALKNHPKILAKTNIYNALVDNKRIDDSKWFAERKMKEEFSQRVETDITTDGEKVNGLIMIPAKLNDKENSVETTTKTD